MPEIVIAAYNASEQSKIGASRVCSGFNDQLEIQAVVNSLPASGGTIYLTEGDFLIHAPIVINRKTYLRGIHKVSTRLIAAGGTNTDIIWVRGSDNRISDMSLDGYRSTQSTSARGIVILGEGVPIEQTYLVDLNFGQFKGTPVYIGNIDIVYLQNVNFIHNSDYAVTIDGSGGLYTRRIWFRDIYNSDSIGGIHILGTNVSQVFIDGGTLENAPRDHIRVEEAIDTIDIKNLLIKTSNESKEDYSDIYIRRAASVTIAGNHFSDVSGNNNSHSIRLMECNQGVIANNQMEGAHEGAINLVKSSGFTVTGNLFRNNALEQNDVYSVITLSGGSTRNLVYGNTILEDSPASRAKHGIMEESSQDDFNVFADNIISGTTDAPVLVSGPNSRFDEKVSPSGISPWLIGAGAFAIYAMTRKRR